jgi:uncharacterized protein (DUF2141 family)
MRFKKARVLALAGAAAAGSLVATAVPAAAATGNVTVTYGSWDCRYGGSPQIALMSIDQGGQVSWQSGDTASTWSVLGRTVQINATLLCHRPWYQGGNYYEYNFLAYRWFNFSGQHTYI